MRITSKGQVTIPQAIREQFGLLPDVEVEFVVVGNQVRIAKAKTSRREGRGERIVRRLRGQPKVSMTTSQIMNLTRGEA